MQNKHQTLVRPECVTLIGLLFYVLLSSLTAFGMPGTATNFPKDVVVEIDEPLVVYPNRKTLLVLYALPNGNTVAWTAGKKLAPGDDWHYDIQHIAAQTQFLRHHLKEYNLILVYLANTQRSWPAWKKLNPNYPSLLRSVVQTLYNRYASLQPEVTLSSHSGGGSFIFGYLDGNPILPHYIKRIAFIDSTYGYELKYLTGLAKWLRQTKGALHVLAYQDSTVVFNGKPLVSATGGTWYRSKQMQRDLATKFKFTSSFDTAFVRHTAFKKRIRFDLKTNPINKIYHTEQVARNGFIYTLVSGTQYEHQLPFDYWGKRAYEAFIPASGLKAQTE
ncbi:MAG: hypothetical protein ACO1OQ_08200 [Rufibacter sp.]